MGTGLQVCSLDIAGAPSFPDMEGELPASSYRSPPVSPFIDISTNDLSLSVSPAPEIHSKNSLPLSPSGAMSEDNHDRATLVSQSSLYRAEQPGCKLFAIFVKRIVTR